MNFRTLEVERFQRSKVASPVSRKGKSTFLPTYVGTMYICTAGRSCASPVYLLFSISQSYSRVILVFSLNFYLSVEFIQLFFPVL